jgi:hypothetical protein
MKDKKKDQVIKAYRHFLAVTKSFEGCGLTLKQCYAALEAYKTMHPQSAKLVRNYDLIRDKKKLTVSKGQGLLARFELELLGAIGEREILKRIKKGEEAPTPPKSQLGKEVNNGADVVQAAMDLVEAPSIPTAN